MVIAGQPDYFLVVVVSPPSRRSLAVSSMLVGSSALFSTKLDAGSISGNSRGSIAMAKPAAVLTKLSSSSGLLVAFSCICVRQ